MKKFQSITMGSILNFYSEFLVLCCVLSYMTIAHEFICPCDDLTKGVSHVNISSNVSYFCIDQSKSNFFKTFNIQSDFFSNISYFHVCVSSDQKHSSLPIKGSDMNYTCFTPTAYRNLKHSTPSFSHTNLAESIPFLISHDKCQTTIQLTDDEKRKDHNICPTSSALISTRTVNLNNIINSIENTQILCTLTGSMLLSELTLINPLKTQVTKTFLISQLPHILKIIFARILMETNEKKLWHQYPQIITSSTPPYARRSVQGLIIWTGSEKNKGILIDQHEMLRGIHPDLVMGWAATDALYPCQQSDLDKGCRGKRRKSTLPRSAMSSMPKGWRCAQTRPLRALAHVLHLFDPQYIVLVDDDTYVNIHLLRKLYSKYLYSTTSSSFLPRYVLGEFMGKIGEHGHISKIGIMGGGSGYIIGRSAILALTSYELTYFGFEISNLSKLHRHIVTEDEFRSIHHVYQHSLLQEVMELCSKPKAENSSELSYPSCVSFEPRNRTYSQRITAWSNDSTNTSFAYSGLSVEHDLVVSTNIRLIDLCVGILAQPSTCLHSDHSVPLCLFYGAKIEPISATCHSTVANPPSNITLGMCMAAERCDKETKVTCHRFKSVRDKRGEGEGGISIHPTTWRKRFYRQYSSYFDGNDIVKPDW